LPNCTIVNRNTLRYLAILILSVLNFFVLIALINTQNSEIEISAQTDEATQHADTDERSELIFAESGSALQDSNESAELEVLFDDEITLTNSQSLPRSITASIKSGDTLSGIFQKYSIPPSILHKILEIETANKFLKTLRPDEKIDFSFEGNHLTEIRFSNNRLNSLVVRNDENGWTATTEVANILIEPVVITAEIQSSLYKAGIENGITDRVVMDIANIFAWDVDFALDIRTGDRFSVLVEKKIHEEQFIGYGKILAAEFINQGKRYSAVHYVDQQGQGNYYTPNGHSLRKAFLRSPIDFYRISSTFQRERFHPVLGVKRPHRGVDYAAPIGTPIKASGDGKIIFIGTQGGYGKTIILQHGRKYTTLYAHLNNFAKNIRTGSKVTQGQVIGFVGKTGVATGPHLHYEFRINDVHHDPLTVSLPMSEPLPANELAIFRNKALPLLAQLESNRLINLSANLNN
jgi:murein DD-endopeptidase MepM/ murein hydrolase activator NlpD